MLEITGRFSTIFCDRGIQIFQESRSHLKILGTRRVIRCKPHTDDPQTLCTVVQILVAWVTWYPGFLQSCFSVLRCCFMDHQLTCKLILHKLPVFCMSFTNPAGVGFPPDVCVVSIKNIFFNFFIVEMGGIH